MFVNLTLILYFFLFSFNDPAPTEIYTLSLHDALPISVNGVTGLVFGQRISERRLPDEGRDGLDLVVAQTEIRHFRRSEEHTSELQSHVNLVCRLLLEKKKKIYYKKNIVNANIVVKLLV